MSPLHADGRHSLAMPSFSCTIYRIARRNRHCRRALSSPPKVPQHSQSENARKEGAPMRTQNHQKGKIDETHRADQAVARLGPRHNGRRRARPLGVGHNDGLAALHGGDGGVGRAQVDADDLRKGEEVGKEFFFFEGEQLAVTRTFQMLRSSASRPRSAGAAMPPPLRPRVRGRQNRAPRTRGDGESARRSGEEGERKAKNQKTTAAQRRRRHQAEVLSHRRRRGGPRPGAWGQKRPRRGGLRRGRRWWSAGRCAEGLPLLG